MDNIMKNIEEDQNNITFLLDELKTEPNNVVTNLNFNLNFNSFNDSDSESNSLIEKELCVYDEYKLKDLMKICQYYGIAKNIKAFKCKKQDIIASIVYFESCPENYSVVQKRNKMWRYITTLLGDSKMKGYILW